MDKRIQEAVSLFEEVLIYGTERVIKSVDDPLWKEYSPEQIQVLKLIHKEGEITSGRLAILQGVHKSAISNRLKKLKEKELVDTKPSGDKREKILVLTQQGEMVIKRSDEVLHEYIGKLMSNQVNDQEIDQFLVTFRKLRKILKMNGV
ncbi:MarR family winged helix-turn-helix transcriptional regulator [Paenisporosarcina sp. OV554]|uniref:MarR family winged helix-turn-helix transcriptional regulator n=1 Tax=Paenisporosarcina sp. OV554 TaxID=2135694 RepID=UPI000D3557D5|nr:MarR family transcriptional regulator [Paenisporosarcina sp. OV554]PUB13394.1 DNA-binding MarR family transcriptional regulator [Paenisporosarcina sp. OV554]